MLQPVEITGDVASPGLVLGPLHVVAHQGSSVRRTGTAQEEANALERAIANATDDLGRLRTVNSGVAADILEFQVAMLADDALRQPAMLKIAAGEAADKAWHSTLDQEIAGYENSPDEYFRARASDLTDIRDRVLSHLSAGGAERSVPAGAVVLAADLPPSRFLEMDWNGGGLALWGGSISSHVAMLARARGIPMLVGMTGQQSVNGHAEALLDGQTGRLVLSPSIQHKVEFERHVQQSNIARAHERTFLGKPAISRNGVPIEVLINVAGPDDVSRIDAASCDGIGLMRSEFLFRDGAALPNEEQQLAAYGTLIQWADGRPVTVRTLDVGGDKPIEGLTLKGEGNPFLGLRGVRLTLARQDVFRVQLRALARAAALGPIKIMLPMVSVPQEIEQSAALLDEVVANLVAAGIPASRPPLGIMVEVPAVAIVPEHFKMADFFSIGSNDLTQYVMAAARDLAAVGSLYQPGNPAVLGLIHNTVRAAREMNRPVSLCGDMAGDAELIPALLAAGLRSLSVAPTAIGRVKAAIADMDVPGGNNGTR